MHVSEVVNPAGPASPRADAGAIIADIEAARRDGTATVEQAMQLMEANIAELEERLVQGGTPAEAAMRSLVARLTEAPTNLHQATVYFAGREPEHEDAGKAMVSFLAGLAIVGLQSAVAVGVVMGTVSPSCISSDQCAAGTFCAVGGAQRCWYCGENAPLPAQIDPATGGTLNDAYATNFASYNLTGVAEVCADPSLSVMQVSLGTHQDTADATSWCEACVRNDGTVDPLTPTAHIADNVAAMGLFDWAALLFATLVAALAVVGELKVRALPAPPSPPPVWCCPVSAWLSQARVGLTRPLAHGGTVFCAGHQTVWPGNHACGRQAQLGLSVRAHPARRLAPVAVPPGAGGCGAYPGAVQGRRRAKRQPQHGRHPVLD
jgi:hypothetical protein